jgi:hypothetical protein
MVFHYVPPKSSYPACGLSIGQNSFITGDGAKVTCKACRSATPFRKRYAALALPSRGRKPKLTNRVSVTKKILISPEGKTWLESQINQAEAIGKLIDQAAAKSN